VSEHNDQNGGGNELLVRFLRSAVHNPIAIKALRISQILYRPDPKDWADTNQIPIVFPGLPPEFDGYRIAQISDFHLGTWLTPKYLLDAVDQVNRLQPDLIAITGDFVTYAPERFTDDLSAAISRLSARDGIVAILGNHDHWTGPELLCNCLEHSGAHILANQVYPVRCGSEILYIAGLDDFMVGKADLEAILRALPDGRKAILLAHEPDFADISAQTSRFILQLSGHAHGGQIVIPGRGPLYLPTHARKYPAGLYNIDGMLLYSNSGLGTAELQFRYNCRPEIAVFTLKSITEDDSL
jgi:predicted MPP superfamily phosphohydrolase